MYGLYLFVTFIILIEYVYRYVNKSKKKAIYHYYMHKEAITAAYICKHSSSLDIKICFIKHIRQLLRKDAEKGEGTGQNVILNNIFCAFNISNSII